jgi:hypothetical protein
VTLSLYSAAGPSGRRWKRGPTGLCSPPGDRHGRDVLWRSLPGIHSCKRAGHRALAQAGCVRRLRSARWLIDLRSRPLAWFQRENLGTTQPLQVVMAGSHVFAEWAGKRVVRRIVSQDIGVSFHAAPRTRPGSCPAPRPHAPSSQDGRAGRPLCRRLVTVWLVPSRCSCEGRSGRGLRPERQTRG